MWKVLKMTINKRPCEVADRQPNDNWPYVNVPLFCSNQFPAMLEQKCKNIASGSKMEKYKMYSMIFF